MQANQLIRLFVVCAVSLALAVPALAQDRDKSNKPDPARSAQAPSGEKVKAKGVIVQRAPDSFTLRDQGGSEMVVHLNDATKVEERKSNPFRGATKYATTQLLRGLNVEVEGRRDSSGGIVADKIKFKKDDYMVARTVESNVTPVEQRVEKTESRLSEAEQNAKRLSGQLEELNAVSNAARGGAKAAQETADAAQKMADAAVAGVNATNERISAVDNYEPRRSATVNFKVNSTVLTREAMAKLDEIANEAKNEKGFVIEVRGFASAEGDKDYNRRLSQRRADAVIRYLVENHNIPLRRIVTPFGYGAANPVADNKTRVGRQQNRRVEVTILVSRGLTTPAAVNRPTGGL